MNLVGATAKRNIRKSKTGKNINDVERREVLLHD
jgi:hypothetical protein